ncbi:MAG: hypothetical protein Q7U78_14245 [Gallionella sp.]|nr:hypothetical protein [Gallionella sp.]
MERMQDSLFQVFCEDCRQRVQRVAGIMQAGVPLSCVQLDQLHQEFDTLFGGARAVHLPEMELFFRSMAIYARYLRNCLREGQTIEQSAWQDLLAGIAMAGRCGGDMSQCFEPCNKPRSTLLQVIENRINKGNAR